MKEMSSTPEAVEDLKVVRNYCLGVFAFGAAVATFFTQAFHFPLEPTLIGTTMGGAIFLVVVFLIYRAEQRVKKALTCHVDSSTVAINDFRKDVAELKESVKATQCSALRTEMDAEIFRNPENHDTIIRYAYRYFKELDADWVQTEKFLTWVESEEKAGRPVHLPTDLLMDVKNKASLESMRK